MISYLVQRRHRYTIDLFLSTYDRELPFEMRVVPYEEALRARRLPGGTYLFTDLDRLDPTAQVRATEVWRALADGGAKLLNHPTRSLLRFELLRELYERGLNDFDAVRLGEARLPKRFPVFLRHEAGHDGAVSGLLQTPAELAEAVAALGEQGIGRERLLAVEYAGAPDPQGLHRKYAAFRIGERIFARHLFFDRDWLVKTPEEESEAITAAELAYVRENPHAEALREIFERARIEYGRIDYSLRDGRIQTWEINTNPMTVGYEGGPLLGVEVQARVAEAFRDALVEIDTPSERDIPLPPSPRSRLRAREWAVANFSRPLRAVGLSRLEPRLRMALYRAQWAWLCWRKRGDRS